MEKFYFWLKIFLLASFCVFNGFLFVKSCRINYQEQLAKEHIRFRESMPTMDSWVNSPFGKLKSYLFNVTNAREFMDGIDSKVKVEQVGPITYEIIGYNDVLNRTEDSITYSKHRYRTVRFLPEESVSPDILNATIIQFNNVLIGATAKMRNMMMIPGLAIDPLKFGEELFITGSIYYFLFEFTRPSLKFLSKIMQLSTNCGPLYNVGNFTFSPTLPFHQSHSLLSPKALSKKKEVFKVNIGPRHGVRDFFRIQSLNDHELISERARKIRYDEECPINVTNTLDNSLFPPLLTKEVPLNIVASESCRVLPLHYQREEEFDGLTGYRYSLLGVNETAPKCMESTYGVKLPQSMFDVSSCVISECRKKSPHVGRHIDNLSSL